MNARSPHRHDPLIVALDFTDLPPALRMARRLHGLVRTVKVGSVLFTTCGPLAIRRLRALGFRVMLDLKFFDIPSTVELSCRAAVRHGVSLLTVHAAGEPAMLEAAVRGVRTEARRRGAARPLVLGVTVLTSVARGERRRTASVTSRVMALTQRALEAGCDGVVASAQEVLALRARFGRRLRIACPGIRLPGARHDDQCRVSSPSEAMARGADLLIVGRPITAAHDPRVAVHALRHDMEERS